jgi:hypothetical protein
MEKSKKKKPKIMNWHEFLSQRSEQPTTQSRTSKSPSGIREMIDINNK